MYFHVHEAMTKIHTVVEYRMLSIRGFRGTVLRVNFGKIKLKEVEF